jgi:hypothetical protein
MNAATIGEATILLMVTALRATNADVPQAKKITKSTTVILKGAASDDQYSTPPR